MKTAAAPSGAAAVPGGKGQRKREATKDNLIEAFGRVVRRNGLRGVGKALLYRYFGGLPGLVQAWGQKNRVWPRLTDLVPLSASTAEAPPGESLKRIVVRNADAHRADPVRIEMLADELMTPTAISGALAEISQRLGRDHAAIFARNSEFRDHHLLMVVMMAAGSYLAMRAVKAPRYMGENLADEQTWARVMQQIESIIDKVVSVPPAKPAPARKRRVRR